MKTTVSMHILSSRLRDGVLAALALCCLAQPVAAQRTALFEGSAEAEWKEAALRLPAYPSAADLIPLDVRSSTSTRFFVDARSLSLAEDGVVRYTLVVRGAGGAENVSFEGIRCATAERKLYALARAGEWVPARSDAWRQIEDNAFNRQHAVLAKEYFCPPGAARPSLPEILDLLRKDAGLR
ncbi:CNP1-like family protein [Zoogloea sp.]|uniref:CNP1-like family protein n=1 Tax=Zoogloea sp. TaxID=49181 RepID=UPI0035B23DAD